MNCIITLKGLSSSYNYILKGVFLEELLYLLTHAGDGDVEHLAVFRNRAAGNLITLIVEDIHKVLIRKRMAFIFVVDALLEDCLYLVARYLLARDGLHTLRKE